MIEVLLGCYLLYDCICFVYISIGVILWGRYVEERGFTSCNSLRQKFKKSKERSGVLLKYKCEVKSYIE